MAAERQNLIGNGEITLELEGLLADERRDIIAIEMFKRYIEAREETRLR